MPIELYVFPPSPRAFKVLVVANHLARDYEMKLGDFRKGEHKSPQYSTLNPNMRMPTLKHGDYVLWESNAIQQYLAVQRPDSSVLPKDEPRSIAGLACCRHFPHGTERSLKVTQRRGHE